MDIQGIHIESLPELERPILIVGFAGWGNALNVSKGMAAYLVRSLKAGGFAALDPDTFYRYDENRPRVDIEAGVMKRFSPPGGRFYAATTGSGERDVVILSADEPNLKWFHFAAALFSLCQRLGIGTIVTLGSMYDNVLHTDRIISGLASGPELCARLTRENVLPISYQGPSAIHTIIQSEGPPLGLDCISLWCHCPYYLQGTTHFGVMAELGNLLSAIGGFTMETEALQARWQGVEGQIRALVADNPDLQKVIDDMRKAKVRGSWESMKASSRKDEKVINLTDFIKPR